MKVESIEFVRSAAGAGDLPDAGLPEFSMVGRSNVGKSTLVNALVKRPVARTSATPGKTRLINLYRVVTGPTGPFYLVDLPGYGYSRKEAREEFERLASLYFSRAGDASARGARRTEVPRHSKEADVGQPRTRRGTGVAQGFGPVTVPIGVLLALDARHPGMDNDLATLQWLRARGFGAGNIGQSVGARDPICASPRGPLLIVVTKIDKLSRNERAKALDRFEQLSDQPVLPVSAATGEGLEDLWKQMVSWVASTVASNRPRSRR